VFLCPKTCLYWFAAVSFSLHLFGVKLKSLPYLLLLCGSFSSMFPRWSSIKLIIIHIATLIHRYSSFLPLIALSDLKLILINIPFLLYTSFIFLLLYFAAKQCILIPFPFLLSDVFSSLSFSANQLILIPISFLLYCSHTYPYSLYALHRIIIPIHSQLNSAFSPPSPLCLQLLFIHFPCLLFTHS
jgi:hypothetical protein